MSEEKQICTISIEEAKHMQKLVVDASNTPMIKFTADPNEKDASTIAWDLVREFQIELGKKYGYDWEKVKVNSETGEVFSI